VRSRLLILYYSLPKKLNEALTAAPVLMTTMKSVEARMSKFEF
jgi:hypothetical protein